MNEELTSEKWEKILALYGDNAYLIVECQWANSVSWSFNNNEDVKEALADNCPFLKILQSAALPFDLAAARAGDVVEIYLLGKWHDFHYKFHHAFVTNNKLITNITGFQDWRGGVPIEDLHMKHPRRVDVKYEN